jgi:hypothetical protein
MEKVIISQYLLNNLDNLVYLLFDKSYFSYLESSETYVDAIIDYIHSIPNLPPRKTKNPKHGVYFVVYRVKNKRTQYFITYNVKDSRYVIKNIFTSYEKGYATYIRGIK